MLLAFFALLLHAPAQAQDDLYYDPATDKQVSPDPAVNNDGYDEGSSKVTRRFLCDPSVSFSIPLILRSFHQPLVSFDIHYHSDALSLCIKEKLFSKGDRGHGESLVVLR